MARHCASASAQYLTAASVPLAAPPLTLACWVRITTQGRTNLIALEHTASQHYFELLLNSGAVMADTYDGTTYASAVTTAAAGVGQWFHAAAVYTSPSSRAAFINARFQGTNATLSTPTPALNLLSVGRLNFQGAATHYQDGDLAHAAIWNVALSVDELTALAGGAPPSTIRPGALVFYAPLAGVVAPEPDLIAGRNLTVVGASAATDPPVPPIVQWDVSVERDNAANHDLDADAWMPATPLAAVTDATGRVTSASVTLTPADLEQLRAGEPFRVRVRNVGGGTITNPQLLAVEIRET